MRKDAAVHVLEILRLHGIDQLAVAGVHQAEFPFLGPVRRGGGNQLAVGRDRAVVAAQTAASQPDQHAVGEFFLCRWGLGEQRWGRKENGTEKRRATCKQRGCHVSSFDGWAGFKFSHASRRLSDIRTFLWLSR